MKKLLALTLSLLMVFAVVPMAMMSSADEAQYSYVTIEDFESHTADTSYASGKKVSDIISNGWNGNGRVITDAEFLNPETNSTQAYKVVNNKLSYSNSGAVFLQLNLTSEQLADSIGFRFYVKGDSSVTKALSMAYTISLNGKNEAYKANTGVSAGTVQEGTWVTVKWGDQDSKGLNWYHNGASKWAYEVQPASVITALNSLTISLQTALTATDAAQAFYVDDFQMIYPYVEDTTAAFVSVTIDGEEVASIANGSTYTVPTPPEHYSYTDGKNIYVGGEEITLTKNLELNSVVETTTVTYTMDEGSRIAGGSTTTTTDGSYVEVDGNWKFALPSKGDQIATFVIPEDWSSKPYYKPINIKYSITKSANAANNVDYVQFADAASNGNSASIVSGYSTLQNSYGIDITEDMYSYRYFRMKLKGGSGWTPSNPNYFVYIDDVTITYEYDFDYVEPVEPVIPVTTDEAASIRLNAKNGIRFYTAFDQEAIDALNVDGEAVEFGTIIAPADVIVDEFTHEDDHVGVKYEADEYWNGNEFVGSIVDIKEANIGREFVGRGYVKIGDTYYYSETSSTRSLKGIATAYAAEGYPGATEDQKALVDSWANA